MSMGSNLMGRAVIILAISFFVTRSLIAAPADEFKEGQLSKFSTVGHSKARGIDLTLSYPQSWTAKEAERPHLVQKFISEGGKGFASLIVGIEDIPLDATTQQRAEMFAESALKDFVPNKATLIEAKTTQMEGLPAGMIYVSNIIERAGSSVETRMLIFVFAYKNELINLQFSVAGPTGNSKLVDYAMELYRPLFMKMANSVILNKNSAAESNAK